jgi:hypothetical protein
MFLRLLMLLRFLMLSFLIFSLQACRSTQPKSDRAADQKRIADELGGEISLKADRETLKEMRKEIPADKQKSNDELALFLQLMKQGTEQPQMVHDKFSSMMQKKRTTFREKVQRLRESYRSEEADRREAFIDKQQEKRNAYTHTKHSAAEQRDFFSKQEKERQLFFADERERRNAFESELSAKSKDFDSYMREKSNEFYEQYRLYSKSFSERPKAKKAVTGETDYKSIDEVPMKPLGTED